MVQHGDAPRLCPQPARVSTASNPTTSALPSIAPGMTVELECSMEGPRNTTTTTTTTSNTKDITNRTIDAISHLVLFSFLGTLARLGLQQWTAPTMPSIMTPYPSRGTLTTDTAAVLGRAFWANVLGCFVMGAVVEGNRMLSRCRDTGVVEEDGGSDGDPSGRERGAHDVDEECQIAEQQQQTNGSDIIMNNRNTMSFTRNNASISCIDQPRAVGVDPLHAEAPRHSPTAAATSNAQHCDDEHDGHDNTVTGRSSLRPPPLPPRAQLAQQQNHPRPASPPLYTGLTTGFCGCLTSFSSYMRDIFFVATSAPSLAAAWSSAGRGFNTSGSASMSVDTEHSISSDSLRPPSLPGMPLLSDPAYSIIGHTASQRFVAVLAILIATPLVCICVLEAGAHFTILICHISPHMHNSLHFARGHTRWVSRFLCRRAPQIFRTGVTSTRRTNRSSTTKGVSRLWGNLSWTSILNGVVLFFACSTWIAVLVLSVLWPMTVPNAPPPSSTLADASAVVRESPTKRPAVLVPLVFAPVGCLSRYYVSRWLNPPPSLLSAFATGRRYTSRHWDTRRERSSRAHWPSSRHILPSWVPLGTFTVNVLGTLVLGGTYIAQHRLSRTPTSSRSSSSTGQSIYHPSPLSDILPATPSPSSSPPSLLSSYPSRPIPSPSVRPEDILPCQMLLAVQDGFCACLTTVSTFVLELRVLRQRKQHAATAYAYAYALVTIAVAIAMLLVTMGPVRWTRASGARGDALGSQGWSWGCEM